jgi:DNA-binding transcriptional regulator GbsR (MarR family)
MPNKSNIPNMSSKGPKGKSPTATERRFVDDVARLLVPWGVPQTAARLYGYLLLFPEPVGLDRISADLAVSKSSTSVAARLLEKYRLVLRHGEPGSRRVLYEVSQDYDGMLTEQNRLIDGLAERLKSGAGAITSRAAHNRLQEMAVFYATIREAMNTALRRWRAASRRARSKRRAPRASS